MPRARTSLATASLVILLSHLLLPHQTAHAQATALAENRDPTRAVNLAPRFDPGERTTYELDIKSDQAVSILGESTVSLDADMNAQLALTTLDPDTLDTDAPPHAAVEAKFTQLILQLKGDGGISGSFDSREPPRRDNPRDRVASVARAVHNTPLILHLHPDGTIQRITGLDAIKPSDPLAATIFFALFSEDALKNMLQPIFRIKPAEDPDDVPQDADANPVLHANTGDTWTIDTTRVESLGIPRSKLTLTLEQSPRSAPPHIHRVSIKGNATPDIPDEARSLTFETQRQTIAGTALWSTRYHRLFALNTEADIALTAKGPFPVQLTTTSATKLKLTDHTPPTRSR